MSNKKSNWHARIFTSLLIWTRTIFKKWHSHKINKIDMSTKSQELTPHIDTLKHAMCALHFNYDIITWRGKKYKKMGKFIQLKNQNWNQFIFKMFSIVFLTTKVAIEYTNIHFEEKSQFNVVHLLLCVMQ